MQKSQFKENALSGVARTLPAECERRKQRRGLEPYQSRGVAAVPRQNVWCCTLATSTAGS